MRYSEVHDEDVDNEPDWKDLTKQAESKRYKWDYFESRDEIGVSSVHEYLKAGSFDDITENNIDYSLQVAHDSLKYLIKENDLDFDDLEEQFPDEMMELELNLEGNSNFNVGSVMPTTLFFHDNDPIDIPDYSDLFEDDDQYVQEVLDFIEYAREYGFTKEEVVKVIENASYGGNGGVGILVEGGDVAEAILNENYELQGTCILYIHGSYNGSGDYEIGKKSRKIKFDKNKVADYLDYGRYCLGEVFGTRDWEYN